MGHHHKKVTVEMDSSSSSSSTDNYRSERSDKGSQNGQSFVNNITVSPEIKQQQKVKTSCCDCFLSMFKS